MEIAVDSNTAYQMDAESGDAIITVDYENHPVKGKLTGITIPKGEQRTVPTVYLDSLYQEYANACNGSSPAPKRVPEGEMQYWGNSPCNFEEVNLHF